MIHKEKVSREFTEKVKQISKDLKINPNWLMQLMYFETAGTFSPSIKNGAGSGATGLIQFMPSTAAGLGTSTSQLANMSAVEQLDWVKKYLNQYNLDKINSYGEFYLVVFYPLALQKDNDFVLGSQNGTAANVYNQNKIFDTNGDGKITKKEVVNFQNNEAKKAGLNIFRNRFNLKILTIITIILVIISIAIWKMKMK